MGSRKVSAVMVLAVVMAVVTTTEAQQPVIPSCAKKLVPCAGFMNSTKKPTPICCGPLKEAVTKELPCLCNLFKDPVTMKKKFNINVTELLKLPHMCGLPGDWNSCKGVPPPKPHLATLLGGNSPNAVAGTTAISGSLLVMAVALLMLW